MNLAKPLKGNVCPADTRDVATGLWGKDPAYAQGGPETKTTFGNYYDVGIVTKPGLAGPILLRGRDILVPNHPVVFVSSGLTSSAVFQVGPVYGTDPDFGSQYTELAIDTNYSHPGTYLINGTQYEEWFWRQGVGTGWTGCVGFQIDGPTFSETFLANVDNS